MRQNDDLLSCLSTIFDVEEFKIQEDFLQISELVYTESVFMNRSTPIDPTNQSLPGISSDTYDNYTTYDPYDPYERFLINYHGNPAFLSEKIVASSENELSIYRSVLNYRKDSYFPENTNLWILGASYDNILKIHAKNDAKCEPFSCYEHSLKSGKICKPGMFCF